MLKKPLCLVEITIILGSIVNQFSIRKNERKRCSISIYWIPTLVDID